MRCIRATPIDDYLYKFYCSILYHTHALHYKFNASYLTIYATHLSIYKVKKIELTLYILWEF